MNIKQGTFKEKMTPIVVNIEGGSDYGNCYLDLCSGDSMHTVIIMDKLSRKPKCECR